MKTKYLLAGALATVSAGALAADGGYELKPYAFGTIGAVHDSLKVGDSEITILNDSQVKFGAQVGVGVQFNENFGTELAYQQSSSHHFKYNDGIVVDNGLGEATNETAGISNRTLALRATVGGKVNEDLRLFGKVGVAGVKHSNSSFYRKNQARVTLGVGMEYAVDENWSVRADYDHYFKGKTKDGITWKAANYAGAGFQYNF